MKMVCRCAALLVPALASCQNAGQSVGRADNSAAVALLQRINSNAHSCWIDSGDRAFRSFRLIPELDTQAGKPRILVVKARESQGLPHFVIEAQGNPPRLDSYGPLASEDVGSRMVADLEKWQAGSDQC